MQILRRLISVEQQQGRSGSTQIRHGLQRSLENEAYRLHCIVDRGSYLFAFVVAHIKTN
ncbi:hypothetical protein PXJ20_02225 [Paraburkholderia sp. A1RI_3L]|uniref:hypothetical protein n=1 Tax=Paraburkholderia TaxID=1822464 RepID=UPI003B817A77